MADQKPADAPVTLTLEQERDRVYRLARAAGCTRVMLRVYAGVHPKTVVKKRDRSPK